LPGNPVTTGMPLLVAGHRRHRLLGRNRLDQVWAPAGWVAVT